MMSFIRANRRRIAGVTIGLLVGLTAFFVGPRDLFDDAGVAAGPVLRETGVAQVSTLSTDHDAEGTLGFVSSATAYITAPPGEVTTPMTRGK